MQRLQTTGQATRHPILVMGPEDRFRLALARELRALSFEVLCAQDFRSAARTASQAAEPPAVLLLPEHTIAPDAFEEQLGELRVRAGAERLIPIAFGRTPSPERRTTLRRAGVELALFGSFGRHALRFQINRALSPWASRAPRGEQRAPKEWRTRTFSGGREKATRCYSLSSRGGYFVTPRPWVVGSEIALELPLQRGPLLLAGHILYTNVSGAGERKTLPRGMAVEFDPLSLAIRDAIRADVTVTQRSLQV